MKKCSRSIICLEQLMFLFCIIIISIGLYFIYIKQNYNKTNSVVKYTSNYFNQDYEPPDDTLLNPYNMLYFFYIYFLYLLPLMNQDKNKVY